MGYLLSTTSQLTDKLVSWFKESKRSSNPNARTRMPLATCRRGYSPLYFPCSPFHARLSMLAFPCSPFHARLSMLAFPSSPFHLRLYHLEISPAFPRTLPSSILPRAPSHFPTFSKHLRVCSLHAPQLIGVSHIFIFYFFTLTDVFDDH